MLGKKFEKIWTALGADKNFFWVLLWDTSLYAM